MLNCIFVLILQNYHNMYHIFNTEVGIRTSAGKYLTFFKVLVVGLHCLYYKNCGFSLYL